MAARPIFVLLLVVAVAIASADGRKDAPGSSVDTGFLRSLLQFPWFQSQSSTSTPTIYPWESQQTQPTVSFPQTQPTGTLPQIQPTPTTVTPGTTGYPQQYYQSLQLNFGKYSDGCPRDYVIKMGTYGLGCVPDSRTGKSLKYPPRDEMSKNMCPRGMLYRLVGNRQPACLPESYVYEGIWEPYGSEESD